MYIRQLVELPLFLVREVDLQVCTELQISKLLIFVIDQLTAAAVINGRYMCVHVHSACCILDIIR